ncbi:GNAT family N-acetyltransferase [Eubacterium sp. 1001713B170207_170306_E7]|uniref:GNAT family N-acetyltransferase n=1 Tax=Eubacterium sp. 1001713B170207_170306_E7 TaxID=2787097 RepID=UPI00189BF2B2|nr:GNAT family N-acetyltransferase [Eubacterium sp. 1001713B170207_170306_E7]
MCEAYINLTVENLDDQHLCCAISDKKHQCGVAAKKQWLRERLPEGHVFRKLDAQGKVFIEYAPLETAWVPVEGERYLYIYCLWVSGSFKGKGHGRALLDYCIQDARSQGCSGVCIMSAKKKKPYLSDKKFLERQGFEVADRVGDYELMALSFDGTLPRFAENARRQEADSPELTIYYSLQCPFIPNCIEQVRDYCEDNDIPLELVAVDTLEKAKTLPAVFNNWAVFYKGQYAGVQLLNTGALKKLLNR